MTLGKRSSRGSGGAAAVTSAGGACGQGDWSKVSVGQVSERLERVLETKARKALPLTRSGGEVFQALAGVWSELTVLEPTHTACGCPPGSAARVTRVRQGDQVYG